MLAPLPPRNRKSAMIFHLSVAKKALKTAVTSLMIRIGQENKRSNQSVWMIASKRLRIRNAKTRKSARSRKSAKSQLSVTSHAKKSSVTPFLFVVTQFLLGAILALLAVAFQCLDLVVVSHVLQLLVR